MRKLDRGETSGRSLLFLAGAAVVVAIIAGWRLGEAQSTSWSRANPAPASRVAPEEVKPAADPVPLYTPDQSLALFKLPPGLQIQCVAAEPMVEAPVAMAFDEDGRAWVVEMRAYMPDAEGRGEETPNGRIVVLEDTDGDATFDKRTVFLDGLVLPRAVMPCFGGAMVLEPPTLYFWRDTDGDGVADTKRELLGGLGGQNPEHAPNGLMYGLDNWVHLTQAPVELRFDGEKFLTRATPGHGQWGITQDEFGRLYYTPNPEALRGDLYPKHYAARNPDQRGAEGINLLLSKSQAVWPACPTPGVNRGYQKGVLRPDGTLADHTAGCGPAIYDASLFPPEFRTDAFTCEPAAFLVRRLHVWGTSTGLQAKNAYDRAEFLTSTDERFRPVNTLVGPDGALYIVDMHRGVIQHKTYLTPYLKDQVIARRLEQPLQMGRIYRVAPQGTTVRARPRLSGATSDQLVQLLDHPDGWWRRTAQRLLVEGRATEAEDHLRRMALSGPTHLARLHALWTMEGLGRLTKDDAVRKSRDAHPEVRGAAVRLLEPYLGGQDESVRTILEFMAEDRDRGVRVQAALSLGGMPGPDAVPLLRRAFEAGREDAMIRGAVISGLRGRTPGFLRDLLVGDWMESAGGRAMVADLCDCVLRSKSLEDRAALVEVIADLGGRQPKGAEFVLSRLRRAQQLESETARILEVSREPRGWLALGANPGQLGERAKESDYYLTWPGKPRVDPPRRLRPLTAKEAARFDKGGTLFGGGCAACHGHDGAGIPGQIPPLAGSARAQGNDARTIRVLLSGLEGTLENAAGTFNGSMPPAPFSNDDDVAAVLTYVRRAWGNAGDPVSPERVEKVREEITGRTQPWTAGELEKIK